MGKTGERGGRRPNGSRRVQRPQRPPRAHRVRRLVAGTAAVALVVFAILTWRLIVAPEQADVAGLRADAVVMLGGPGEVARYELAMSLVRDGVAPLALLSEPGGSTRAEGHYWPACKFPDPALPAICFDTPPDERNTRGEARVIGRYAAERGWSRIVLVTAKDHLSRAELIVERCTDAQVLPVASANARPAWYGVLYEWGALARALVVRRGC